ncbi:MAG TPA: hypothetical protein VFE23_20645 [Usitatibacter sp.]|jgi:hypothetical protein|nr:hypothetical protein [Usitatibacter sp.]
MRTTATSIAGAALLMSWLAGCDALMQGPPGAGDGCKTSGGVCKVEIGVPPGCTTGDCVTLTDDPVHVGDGSGRVRDVNLLWKLPTGYAFCMGDGVEFSGNTQNQFTDNYPTDDPQGARDHAAGGRKNYHWKDANTYKDTFKYTVRFHDAQCGTPFRKDPGVINDM